MSSKWLNIGAASLALLLSAWLAAPERTQDAHARSARVRIASAKVVREHGRDGLRDASGAFVPLQRYERVVSTSGVTDSVLLALAEPTRIAAFTRFGAQNRAIGYRYAGKPQLADIGDIEAILALKPDLVLVNSLGGAERIQRLRDAGLTVFDLGEMQGMATLLPNIATIGQLLGRGEAGELFARRFALRMRTLADVVPEAQRPSALYVAIYGDGLYGGGEGTSYHDVLQAAGLRDAAVGRYRGFMRYTPEMLLSLDPEVIVTHDGMTRPFCKHPGLAQLKPCGHGGRVVEVDGSLLDDPSLTMLDAAEAVFEALHHD